MISLYLYFSLDLLFIFLISLFYLYNYSFLKLILLLEASLVLICLLFLTLAFYLDNTFGQVFALFLLGAAAGETALGLSIFVKNAALKETFGGHKPR